MQRFFVLILSLMIFFFKSHSQSGQICRDIVRDMKALFCWNNRFFANFQRRSSNNAVPTVLRLVWRRFFIVFVFLIIFCCLFLFFDVWAHKLAARKRKTRFSAVLNHRLSLRMVREKKNGRTVADSWLRAYY